MPTQNVVDPDLSRSLRERLSGLPGACDGAAAVAARIAAQRYHSEEPAHRAAVDANELRCEVHALALATPDAAALRVAAHAMDAAAGALDEYATALGV